MNARGLFPFIISQATGVINDNIFRLLFTFAVISGASGAEAAAQMGLIFMAPFVLLTPLAGAIADRYPLHLVTRAIRLCEIPIVALGMLAFFGDHESLMYVVLFLLGTQSALYTPTKYAAPAQLVETNQLATANGWLQGSVAISILLGTLFSAIADTEFIDELRNHTDPSWIIAGLQYFFAIDPIFLIGGAVSVLLATGVTLAFRIPAQPALNPDSTLWRSDTLIDPLRTLSKKPALWISALAIGAFWCMGAITMVCLPEIIKREWNAGQSVFALLNSMLTLGIAVGAAVAAKAFTANRPFALPLIGSVFVCGSLCAFALTSEQPNYTNAALYLVGIGIGGGFMLVPLNTIIQKSADPQSRGQAMAGAQLAGTLGTILGFVVVQLFGENVSGSPVLFGTSIAFGSVALLLVIIARWEILGQIGLWLVRCRYRVTIHGAEHLPANGGCVVVANHLTYADGPLLTASLERRLRALVHGPYVAHPIVGRALKAFDAIPVEDGRASAVKSAINAGIATAQSGEAVLVFPEGKLSSSGNIDTFRAGAMRIAERADVPIIPIHIAGLEHSLLGRNPLRCLRWWRRPVTIRIGAPLAANTPAAVVRQRVIHLSAESACETARSEQRTLGEMSLAQCRKHPLAPAVADDQGVIKRWQIAGAAMALRNLQLWSANDQRVGVLLPPGRAGAMANLAITIDGKSVVNLNHTLGIDGLNDCCRRAGITTIISANRYLKKINLSNDDCTANIIAFEDIKDRLSPKNIVLNACKLFCLPISFLCKGQASDEAMIIFSSGSTSTPKGVQLTHQQVIANCQTLRTHLSLNNKTDSVCSPLPLFHSFGSTVGMWVGLCLGTKMVNTPDPRDGTAIGKVVAQHGATILVSTPTFARGYMRRIEPEQFASLRFAVVGAEKCHEDLQQQFKEKYNAELLEGFGATELAPVVSANLPNIQRGPIKETRNRPSSVGRALPGVSVWAVDPNTMEPRLPGEDGLLMIHSPARMMGYLDDPERTAAALHNEAYNTGDIGHVDADGFIFITGRLARFAKIGGEMVPLDRVEEVLQSKAMSIDEECQLAVSAVPDASRGERLVVLHSTAIDAQAVLSDLDLPPIFIPKAKDFYPVENIPVLGTGKRDLGRIKQLAAECAG